MSLGLKITNINIMAQLKVKQISDFVSAVASVHNGVVGTTTATAISTAKTEAILDAATAGDLAYDTLGSADDAQSAAALDATTKANAAKSEAISSSNGYSDGLAGNYDAVGSADDAQSAAALDATTKANDARTAAISSSNGYSDGLAGNYDAAGSAGTAKSEAIAAAAETAESKDVARALTTKADIKVQKDRIDAILNAVDANPDSFADVVTLINNVDTVNDNALATVILNLNNEISTTNSDITRIEAALAAEVSATNGDVTRIENALAAEVSSTNGDVTRIDNALAAEIADTDADVTRLEGLISAVAGTAKIEQIATFINATQFYLAKAVNDANNDVLVYVNGLQIHRSSVGVDGFSITNGGFNFQVSNLGYSLEANDHIVVIGIEHSNQDPIDPIGNPKDLTELPV